MHTDDETGEIQKDYFKFCKTCGTRLDEEGQPVEAIETDLEIIAEVLSQVPQHQGKAIPDDFLKAVAQTLQKGFLRRDKAIRRYERMFTAKERQTGKI